MAFDVFRVRGLFPALIDGYVHLDSPTATLVPESVSRAVAEAIRVPYAPPEGPSVASARAAAVLTAARRAVADLTGGDPAGVILGPDPTTITYTLARTLAKTWRIGDEIVVSRLDHDANIRPWVHAASYAGATVRWAEVDVETCELPTWQYEQLINEHTKFVAITAASSVVGTRPEVRKIADMAHAVGALVHVDGVHASTHMPIDVADLGADFFVTAANTWCGPHIAAAVAAPEVLDRLHPDKLVPTPDSVPERFEGSPMAYELLAGLPAAVDHLAALDPAATGSRRERVLASMAAVEDYERGLFARLVSGLRWLSPVTLMGDAGTSKRAPTVAFMFSGHKPRAVVEELARRKISAWDGDCYAHELMEAVGAAELGGVIRVGLAHYTSAYDVDRLLDTLQDFH
ncbi:MAG TPA: cysteine desulfurase-like protein [Mycobacteriales bacterium]|jgi:cysteine desulfurase family protein (TIGR01976 family)|nr:cysteine desulfurase-like protein [Mycobacteriales bacterium]